MPSLSYEVTAPSRKQSANGEPHLPVISVIQLPSSDSGSKAVPFEDALNQIGEEKENK